MTHAAALKTVSETQDQHDAALALLTVTSDLTKLLTDESNLLVTGHANQIAALAGRKSELLAAYQSAMMTVKEIANPRLMVDDALRKSLRETAQHFKAALERNQSLLSQRLETAQNLMKTIGNEVQRQQNPVKTYANPNGNAAKTAPTSIALNQTI